MLLHLMPTDRLKHRVKDKHLMRTKVIPVLRSAEGDKMLVDGNAGGQEWRKSRRHWP